jgi:hypothetical protein
MLLEVTFNQRMKVNGKKERKKNEETNEEKKRNEKRTKEMKIDRRRQRNGPWQ